MEVVRFFVSNIPHNSGESDLTEIFKYYGEVVDVDLKTKENPGEVESVRVIAFVKLKINKGDVEDCLYELNRQRIAGSKINVSLAKESFLDRLKREREEADADRTKEHCVANSDTLTKSLPQSLQNTRRRFADDENADEVDDLAADFVSKKRAWGSLHNGKIIIQNYDVEPLHVIETKKPTKRPAAQSCNAEEKRKESLQKMQNDYQQKKSVIQKSLMAVGAESSKKIRFGDSDEESNQENHYLNSSKKNIFGSDEENPDDAGESLTLKLKPEHFGSKGKKLLELQSMQSGDKRFKLTENFIDNDGEDGDNRAQLNEIEESPVEDERNWQLKILEQVVGTEIDKRDTVQKAASKKEMVRYDPSKQEHAKFLRVDKSDDTRNDATNNKINVSKSKKGKSKDNRKAENTTETSEHLVSSESYYVVTDTLAEALKSRGDGFSLLSMFGKTDELKEREEQLKMISQEKILIKKHKPAILSQFHNVDSSTDTEDEMLGQTSVGGIQRTIPNHKELKAQTAMEKNAKVKMSVEPFFLLKNDARFNEGAEFFKFEQETNEDDYAKVRTEMKALIRKKIGKTVKSLSKFKAGQKQKKRRIGRRGLRKM